LRKFEITGIMVIKENTQKNDIKKPISSAESGLIKQIIKPAIPKLFNGS